MLRSGALRVCILVCLFITSRFTNAQDQQRMDSLRMVLEELPHDTTRFPVLNVLFNNAARTNPDKAVDYANEFLTLARAHQDQERIADAENKLGVAYTMKGDQTQALEHFFLALNIMEERGEISNAALLHSSIANSFAGLGQFEKAVDHYRRSIAGYARSGEPLWEAGIANELGKVYRQMGWLDSAEVAYGKAADILVEVGGTHGASARSEQAALHAARGDPAGAIPLYRQALEQLGEGGDAPARSEIELGLGTALSQTGSMDEALQHLNSALRLSKELRLNGGVADSYKALAEHYRRSGDLTNAYDALTFHMQWRDSLHNQERTEALLEVQERYAMRQKDLELQRNKALLEKRATGLNAAIALAIAATIAGIAFFVAYYQRRRSIAALSIKNKEVEQALADKELLLRELHHRVKNNLQTIAGLLRMQMRTISDPTARDAIRDGQDRVRSMALIHQDLYHADDLRGVDMVIYIEKLVKGLIKSHEVDPQRITVQVNVDPIRIDLDTAIPIGLILNELIVNALKYAYPDERTGLLNVALREQENALDLEVSDNGAGMDLDEDAVAKGSGFGMVMLRTFAEKLQAEYQVNGVGGTTISMRIHNYKITG
ncbi:MAG: tetratricopeptide repeat protein [Flavobacteriales bacterium]